MFKSSRVVLAGEDYIIGVAASGGPNLCLVVWRSFLLSDRYAGCFLVENLLSVLCLYSVLCTLYSVNETIDVIIPKDNMYYP